jgi:hypothetical protein
VTAWDRLQILAKRFSDQQVRMVVELDGRLDESRLVEAARAHDRGSHAAARRLSNAPADLPSSRRPRAEASI